MPYDLFATTSCLWTVTPAPSGPVFHAATMDPATGEMLPVAVGDGPMSVGRDTDIWQRDYESIYRQFMAGEVGWKGGRVTGAVGSRVVYGTDEQGDPLAEMPWIVSAPQATNIVTYSNDLADASWTASNVTVAQDAEGIDGGATTGCTLTATVGNGTVICAAVTAGSGNHATNWYIKRKTGTGTIELTLDNGSTWQDVTSSISADYTLIAVDQAALTNPQIGIRIVTSGDAVYVGNAECYAATLQSAAATLPPIFTSGAAVMRSADLYTVPDTNHSDVSGAYYLEVIK